VVVPSVVSTPWDLLASVGRTLARMGLGSRLRPIPVGIRCKVFKI